MTLEDISTRNRVRIVVSISIVKALRLKKYNFVMKTNNKVAAARDCQESRGKRVDFIVVVLTSFQNSYSFLFVQTLLSHCTRLKQKRTVFFGSEGVFFNVAHSLQTITFTVIGDEKGRVKYWKGSLRGLQSVPRSLIY